MKYLIFTVLFAFGIQTQAHPYFYVRVRPDVPRVVVVHPACPSPRHIWIEGEWAWNPRIRNYEYGEGRWVIPPPQSRWIPGHWKQTYHGFFWMPGHWRRY